MIDTKSSSEMSGIGRRRRRRSRSMRRTLDQNVFSPYPPLPSVIRSRKKPTAGLTCHRRHAAAALLLSLLMVTPAVGSDVGTDNRQPNQQRKNSFLRRSLESSLDPPLGLATEMGVYDVSYADYDATSQAFDAVDGQKQQPQFEFHPTADAEDDSDTIVLAPESRIVGGTEAEIGDYRYYASLQVRGYPICGASLIAPDLLLCAGHCAGGFDNAVIGRHDLKDSTEPYEKFTVKQAVVHPRFKQSPNGRLDYDFMIIKLNGASQQTPVKLDCASSSSSPPTSLSTGRDLTVMGFGRTSSGGPGSTVMLDAKVGYVSNSACRQASDHRYSYQSVIGDNMLCAKGDGTDSCQGDSGGPLIVKGPQGPESDVCVGVVSFGAGCADPIFPGIYARVSTACQWIEEQVAELSDFGPLSTATAATATGGTTATSVPTSMPTSAPTSSPSSSPAAEDTGGEREEKRKRRHRNRFRMDTPPSNNATDVEIGNSTLSTDAENGTSHSGNSTGHDIINATVEERGEKNATSRSDNITNVEVDAFDVAEDPKLGDTNETNVE